MTNPLAQAIYHCGKLVSDARERGDSNGEAAWAIALEALLFSENALARARKLQTWGEP